MKIVIVRHADPYYEIDSLTEKGFREAELLKKRIASLNPDYIYCSPLGRARDTARPTLDMLGMDATICDWLREFTGKIEIEADKSTIPWDLMPSYWTSVDALYNISEFLDTAPMNTGNMKEKYDEVCKELDLLIERHGYKKEGRLYKAVCPNSDTIVLFCHFGVECVLLSHILNISPILLWQGFVALPSSVTTLATEEREEGIAYFRCSGFGDISHLYAGDEEPSFAARFCELYENEDERH